MFCYNYAIQKFDLTQTEYQHEYHKICVSNPNNIQDQIYDNLFVKYGYKNIDEMKSCYCIIGIVKIDCQGCIYDYPGQLDHMQCPTGCLHYYKTCNFCNTNVSILNKSLLSNESIDSVCHTFTSIKCEGCMYDCLKQTDHMTCPNGCLHSVSNCEQCLRLLV